MRNTTENREREIIENLQNMNNKHIHVRFS